MQYKTIVLEMLKERTELHEQLRLTRRLLPTMEVCARRLKESHERWITTLVDSEPEGDASQISSQALELAMKDLQDRLPPVSPEAETEPLSLDKAIAFIQSPSSKK